MFLQLTPSDTLTAKNIRRFLAKVAEGSPCLCQDPAHNCWQWTAQIISTGDGIFRVGTTRRKAQEVAYVGLRNVLDAAQTLRRVCTTRGCCNPACMVLAPKKASMRKGFREGPLHIPYGQGRTNVARSALQPGAVTRRDWIRFMDKVSEGEPCFCREPPHRHWLWQAGLTTAGGYGNFGWRGKTYNAHRFATIALGASIPPGYEPDHLCRIRRCVNPACIEVVTKKVNGLRGMGVAAICARKTHCLRGHQLFGDNLVPNRFKRGERCCRICKNAQERLRYNNRAQKNSSL